MQDRNTKLMSATLMFKAALLAHLASQPGVKDRDAMEPAVDRILNTTLMQLADESFKLEESFLRALVHEIIKG